MKHKISIIIPCRNEEKYIVGCLDSLKEQTFIYPYEIIVVDGASTDHTKELVKGYEVKIFDNPKKYTPISLNIGLANATGDIIIRIDSHSVYDNSYVFQCIKTLEVCGADLVGGMVIPISKNNTLESEAILKCLYSRFGSGSDFRIMTNEVKETDTVFCGCFRKELIDRVGGYNENLIRSQDMEFAMRVKKSGGKIIYNPEIVTFYYPKETLWEFLKHNIQDGIWAIYPLKFGVKLKLRHYLPLMLVLTLPISILPYLALNLYFSIRGKNILLPFAFMCRHFGYGIGSLIGLKKLWI